MQATAKITSFQFYTILFLSRIFSLVTYVSSVRGTISTSGEVIAVVLMTVVLLLTAVPMFIFIKQDSCSSILTRASCVSPYLMKIICIVYFLAFLYKGIITASRFELLLGSVMFPETNVLFFVAILLMASAFITFRGIEGLGRSSVIFLIPVLCALSFVFLSLIKDFDNLNFSAVYSQEYFTIADAAVYSVSRTGEIACIAVLQPFIKEHKAKHLFRWIIAISAVIVLTEFMISGVLGGFGENQLFNMYSLSVLADFGFIERMDAIISCIWMICSAVKLSLIFYLCKTLMITFFAKNRTKTYVSICCAVVFVGTVILSGSIINFADVIKSSLTIIFYVLTVVIIPLAVIISEKVKVKK